MSVKTSVRISLGLFSTSMGELWIKEVVLERLGKEEVRKPKGF